MNKNTVIDFTECPKNAALYFDYVIPLHPAFCLDVIRDCGCFPYPAKYKSLFPDILQNDDIKYFEYWSLYQFLSFSEDRYKEHFIDVVKFLDKNGLSEVSLLLPPELNFLDESYCECYECSLVRLSQLSLIDPSKTKWEHIFEFRKDVDSVKKLQKLKLFFYENYSGKDKSYIQDDLLNRLEKYQDTVKDWGFETITSTLTLLSTSVSTFGSSLIMALTGQPIERVLTTGICVGIANISLHIAKEKHNLAKIRRDNPLAYIIEAKNKLEKRE